MVARKLKVLTTEKLTRVLGLDPQKDKWRIVKFAESREYNIKPSVDTPTGRGSRRLYNIEDACEIALALRLLETGLRSRVIGRVIRGLRKKGKLSANLERSDSDRGTLNLVITRIPVPGKPLDETRQQVVGFARNTAKMTEVVGEFFRNPNVEFDVILVPVSSMFRGMRQRLDQLESEIKKAD
jgi:DNA-binding transcriptional MerR regulator